MNISIDLSPIFEQNRIEFIQINIESFQMNISINSVDSAFMQMIITCSSSSSFFNSSSLNSSNKNSSMLFFKEIQKILTKFGFT